MLRSAAGWDIDMTIPEKVYVIYMIGLVLWTTVFYLMMRGSESAKKINLEFLALFFGVFWFVLLPAYLFKALLERREKK
jgi:xanthine/uracil permease